MKKSVSKLVTAFLLALAICVTGVIGNEASVDAKTKIKISNTKITLTVGQSKTLKVKGTKKKPKWSSSKKSVATVSSKGKVVAKKAGSATITAKIGKKKYNCKVTVKNKKKQQQFGKMTGKIEDQEGNPDYESSVILIPKNGKAKSMKLGDEFDWCLASDREYVKYNVYGGTVYETGRYTINSIVPGKYVAVVISNYYDDNNDVDDYDYFDLYFENILSDKNVDFLREYIRGYDYDIYPEIVIKANKTTKLDEYFWYYND